MNSYCPSCFIMVFALLSSGCFPENKISPSEKTAVKDGYLFCMWNVENFFDNKNDHRKTEPDKEYDSWFGDHPADFKLKLDHIVEVLLKMNNQTGPDILALAEVEEDSLVPELLKAALNSKLPPDNQYQQIAFKNPHGGRCIATCVISKLPIVSNRVNLLGKRVRILEVPIRVNGKELIVLATHWTSKLTDKEGTGRAKYADQIHGAYIAMARNNPDIDFLVCGDFNSTPDEACVKQHLKTTSTEQETMIRKREIEGSSGESRWLDFPLFNPFSDWKEKKIGSIYYQGKFELYDQIVVSPGLLDNKGWSCDPFTAKVFNSSPPADSKGHPVRFGSEKDHKHARGYSDHLPVTIRLKVHEN